MADPLADRSQGSRVLGNDCAVAFRSGIDRQVCLRRAPALHPPEPSYHYGKPYNLQKYVEFMTGQITELLTQ